MAAFRVVIGNMMADSELGCDQTGKAPAIEEFGFEAAPSRFGVGITVAVAAPAPALRGFVAGQSRLEVGGRVLSSLVRMPDEAGRWPAHGEGAAQCLAHVPTNDGSEAPAAR